MNVKKCPSCKSHKEIKNYLLPILVGCIVGVLTIQMDNDF